MKKILIVLAITGLLNAPTARSFADQAVFNLSVTIPAIPGVNVALDNATGQTLQTGTETEENVKKDDSEKKLSPLDVIEQKIIEEQQILVLVTLIEK